LKEPQFKVGFQIEDEEERVYEPVRRIIEGETR
jgi:hypothetical protein